MTRATTNPSSRRHILVYDEDWEWLEAQYHLQDSSGMTPGVLIRELIHKHVKTIKAHYARALDQESANNLAGDEL